ncbi:MAG TPA: cyclic nucleotide-binding domain-containing protein [Chloroflexia bacterium]|nr:cyclic nucleotide-binding domain-containing protein [Chloroflexia bacterium]
MMNSSLEIITLGRVRVRLGDRELTGTLSNKAVALLIYLACESQPQSRLHLAELFWPERSEEQALSNLRTLLTRLRTHLEPYLVITRSTIAFNQTQPYHLDIAELELGLKEVSRQVRKADSLSKEITAQIEPNLKLYRGEFLAGFYLSEAPGFEEWSSQIRTKLQQQISQALYQMIAYKEREAHYEEATELVNRLLELDPLQEEAHRRRMWLLAQSGQRHAALNHYKIYQQYLARELDIAPEAPTTDLFEKIKKNEIPAPGSNNSKALAVLTRPNGLTSEPSDQIDQLKRVSIFASTPEHLLAELAKRLEEVSYRAGEVIFEKGEPGECMYIIAEGQVRVHDGQRTINDLSTRDIFGEMAVLDTAPRLATVTALTDARLWRLDQVTLYELMAGRIEVVKGIIGMLSQRLRERVQDVVELDSRLHAIQDQND